MKRKIFGTAGRPRLTVNKSNVHIYAQIVDDEKGETLVSMSDLIIKKSEKATKAQKAEMVGEEIAKKAIAKKIKKVVFDRGRFTYHGRVKAVAEGARKGGLNF